MATIDKDSSARTIPRPAEPAERAEVSPRPAAGAEPLAAAGYPRHELRGEGVSATPDPASATLVTPGPYSSGDATVNVDQRDSRITDGTRGRDREEAHRPAADVAAGETAPTKPILLGAHNPHSLCPDRALGAQPRGSAGWRLWQMVRDASWDEVTAAEYEAMFDRRNLCAGARWDPREARAAAMELRNELPPGSVVVALGQDVWRSLRLRKVDPRRRIMSRGVAYYYLPHPSGLNHFYNDALECWWAGRFLLDLAGGGARCRR